MTQPWIRLSKEGKDVFKLFCFPYSGGMAQVFRPFSNLLPQGVGVYGFELPGRGRRFTDTPLTSIYAMIKEALNGITPLHGNNSMFFGHSLGGILAFELARELRRQHLPIPRQLFVSGIRAPHVPRREGKIYNLSDKDFIGKLMEMGGTPMEILENKEMLDLVLPSLRKDFQAYDTYVHTPELPLSCPITAFGGSMDTFVTADDVKQWAMHTNILFTSRMFEGDHFFIHEQFSEIAVMISKAFSLIQPL